MSTSRPLSVRLSCLFTVASFALTGSARSAPVQWPISEGGNGHFYEYVHPIQPPQITWTAARDAAAAVTSAGVAGHLATVTSEAERLFLFNQLNRVPTSQVWLGGVQGAGATTASDRWSWITGETWDYTAWNTGEPNDWPGPLEDGGEQYLSMNTYATGTGVGQWNDNDNQGVPAAYVVEYDVTPEPSAAGCFLLGGAAMLVRRRR